jgi:hypothetical protein
VDILNDLYSSDVFDDDELCLNLLSLHSGLSPLDFHHHCHCHLTTLDVHDGPLMVLTCNCLQMMFLLDLVSSLAHFLLLNGLYWSSDYPWTQFHCSSDSTVPLSSLDKLGLLMKSSGLGVLLCPLEVLGLVQISNWILSWFWLS